MSKQNIAIQIRLSKEYVEKIDELRSIEGISRAAWVRRLIIKFFHGLLVEKDPHEVNGGEGNGSGQ